MTKIEKRMLQNAVNDEIESALAIANNSVNKFSYSLPCAPLRTCTAEVYFSNRYIYLKSYKTIVAMIDTESGAAYDFLRYVYGYTATSAQHISKFFADYSSKISIIKTWKCAD